MTELAQIMPRHYAVMDLLLSGSYKIKEIAEITGMTTATIQNIRNTPEFQDKIAKRRKEREDMLDELDVRDKVSRIEAARDRLEAAASRSASVLIDNLLDDDSRIRNKAANDILDRIGISRVTKTDVSTKTAVLVLSADDAERIHRAMNLDQD